MLKHRLLTAFILIPLVIVALLFLPLPYFAAVIIILCALGASEWAQFLGITAKKGKTVCGLLTLLFFSALYYGFPPRLFHYIVFYSLGMAVVWWFLAAYLVTTFPKSASFWDKHNVLKFGFGVYTLLPFFTSMIALRSHEYSVDRFVGAILVLYVLLLIWAMDSGAYFFGRAFGKHKLAPSVSPGKTLEGFFGGLILTVILVYAVNAFFGWPVPIGKVLFVSIIAALASVLGDLTESMFKREAGIKDSGYLLPGHGGVLDRLDSLFAAAPVFVAVSFILFP